MRTFCAPVILLWLTSLGFGTAFPPTGKWTSYTNADSVYALCPGISGMWAGTTGGALYCETNASLQKFTNVEGLPGNYILSIATSASGEIWFGMNGDGVSEYTPSGNVWRQYTTYDGLEDNRVISILADGNILWFGMDGGSGKRGLVRFDDKGTPDNRQDDEWTPYDSLTGYSVQSLGLKGDTLWIATSGGLFRAIRTTSYPYLSQWQRPLWGQDARSMAFEPGAVWVSTYGGGVFRWAGSSWTLVNTGLSSLNVNGLALAGNQLWAATDSGMAQYDFANSRWVVHNEGLTDPVMRRVAFDVGGQTWSGGSQTGLWFRENNLWQRVVPNQISNDWVDHLCLGPSGEVLVSHGQKGIGASILSQGQWDTLRIPHAGDTTFDWVSAVSMEPDGMIWLGTWLSFPGGGGGLFRLGRNGAWTHYTTENTNQGLRTNIIAEIARDSLGNFYIGCWRDAVSQILPDCTWTSFSYAGAPYGYMRFLSLHADRKGRLWCGLYDGLLSYDRGVWSYYYVGSDPSLPENTVWDIAEDDSGHFWIATFGGLVYFDEHSFTTFTRSSTGGWLPSDQVYAVDLDSQGWVWAGTSAGLAVYDPQRKCWANFFKGSKSLVHNDIRKLRIRLDPQDPHQDQIWVGTTNGISLFVPDNPFPTDLGSVYVFPNPYLSAAGQVTFQGLPDKADIWIFTTSGELVKHLSNPDIHRHNLVWDGRNESGHGVASGLYPYLVKGAGRTHGGTLAILR